MKKISSFSALALVGSLLVAACHKAPDHLIDPGTMTASAGGASFNSVTCYENFILSNTNDFTITGTGTDGSTFIVLRIRGTRIYPGDYLVDTTNNGSSAWYIQNGTSWQSYTGKITVTSDSAGIATSGSFNFTTIHDNTVSGSFRAVFRQYH
jgi:hypothetical protein